MAKYNYGDLIKMNVADDLSVGDMLIMLMTEGCKQRGEEFAALFFPNGISKETTSAIEIECKINGVEVTFDWLVTRYLDGVDAYTTERAQAMLRGVFEGELDAVREKLHEAEDILSEAVERRRKK